MGSPFHELTEEELKTQLDEAKKELRELRFQYAVARSLQSPARVEQLRRNVARVLTVQRERAMGKATIKPKTTRTKKDAKAKEKAGKKK